MAFSQYFATQILDWSKGTTFPSALSSVHVTLHTADPGTDGTTSDVTNTIAGSSIYSKSLASSSLGAVGAAGGGGFEIKNTAVLQITASAVNASTLTVTHFGIWDAACSQNHTTSENFIASGPLTTSVSIVSGDTVQFNTGDMSIKVV